ncbi:hypothetical protein QOL99_00175 [Deinococcus sp. MIMF12]|uniref:DUF4255 domain-containing protein n=1 Tax=Deinococcus rhizophilus TaxID=3049544 RepID=A0ABT7JBZ0_9DEIO|nr:hypothetical protein [Deinococcus rhizophilus]MDL2342564.1 hypothetical protein [Deinococcus rhizophilus]
MTTTLTVADPRPALRVLYHALKVTLGRDGTRPGLLDMAPRPLLAAQIVPGASEFAVSAVVPPGAQPKVAGHLIRRVLQGYVSLHFPLGDNPGDGVDEAALIGAVLERAGQVFASYPTPGVTFAGMGDLASDLFINDAPAELQKPAVLTLTTNFDLVLDLRVELKESP